MYEETLQNPSKIRVGIIKRIKSLPASPTVERAMELTRQALIKSGYEVVDVSGFEEDYSKANNYVVGMVANGTIRHLADDFDKTGEKVQLGLWSNILILRAGPLLRNILTTILKVAGMGRLVSFLKYAYLMNNDELDALYRERE